MSETIGRITITEETASVSFPFVSDYPHGRAKARQVIAHSFGDPRVEQRFYAGDPAERYTFVRRTLSNAQRAALAQFWADCKGGVVSFLYQVPQEDQSFVYKTVRFENAPLSLEDLAGSICSCGVTFVEIPDPDDAPVYTTASGGELTRFPDSSLATALLDEVQEIIPLVRIRVSETAVNDIFLSDRRVTVDRDLYQPRLLRVGEPGSDVLIQQSIDGSTDDVQFAFGNADRLMIQLANDTELKWATIELSLYQVQTGYKLNLWAGRIVEWASDAGPEFIVRASDPLSALTLSSPVRVCSHSCWRRYGLDGCPATIGTQPLDTTHFPDADADWCDLGYETPNGCLAHSPGDQTKRYFGGAHTDPKKIIIHDTSTGLWGIGQQTITPTSQINDSFFGTSLPEIWHHDDGVAQRGLPVNCKVATGREESDFYEALGVVGAGPLGAFTLPQMVDTDADGIKETYVGPTLDGQPSHLFKTDENGNTTETPGSLGLHLGADPAGEHDYFSLDETAGTPSSYREVQYGASIYRDDYAAGVAFIVIRRTDESGVQLSVPASHSMIASISQGLTGWTWTEPGTRESAPGCTNPFWVAINTYLRAIGANGLSASAQEAYFDVDAAAVCAADADTIVPQIFGGSTEKQFRFKGTIDTSKPTRDWIRDILNNGLGYFTWSFGRLRVGIRINADAVTSFHSGNMLFGSLKITPLVPQFEKLTVEFADEDYLFVKNTVDFCDQDHAARYGRIENPLSCQIGLVGAATKSQAARYAVVRTREELGGISETEQKKARVISWKSTIMALDTEAGMAVAVFDDDIPDGCGKVRIQSIRVNRDWSIDFTARTVTDSMYDLTVGTVPAAVSDATQPTPAILPGQQTAQFAVNDAILSRDDLVYINDDSVTASGSVTVNGA
jgi:hypothetical protein